MMAPMIGATQNNQSWLIAAVSANNATAVLQAGFAGTGGFATNGYGELSPNHFS